MNDNKLVYKILKTKLLNLLKIEIGKEFDMTEIDKELKTIRHHLRRIEK